MKYPILILLSVLLIIGCATVDVEKSVRDQAAGKQAGDPLAVLPVPVESWPQPSPEVIVRERPVYVPTEPGGSPVKSPPEPTGMDAVRASNTAGIQNPGDYTKGAMLYDFDADWVYEIYTQPLRLTDIQLEAGETVADTPFVSDSERWMLGAGVSYEGGSTVQHVYVKPTAPALEASLVINTNRRSYHIVLRSYNYAFMPIVRWRYASTGLPNTYAGPLAGPMGIAGTANTDIPAIDPRYLSFNYRITYGRFHKPVWLPTLAYDDGKKTYVAFPEDVLQSALPAVFEDRANVVNYRVAGNLLIIDKRIEKITVTMGETKITIEKKKGK
ncbi:MAG: TrbG/VirB9 family P-type conjugative transfer protein [Spirochaetaceae bacterium]|jgi:type IV secretion system protein VirB9|nr:TrbG/VirB9 family P-type conjugative transfer protein [Spirochaetaceae bacterium]